MQSVVRKNGQKRSLFVHVEFTRIDLPNARFPIGGKQVLSSVHVCCAVTEVVRRDIRKRSFKYEDERLKWLVVLL